MRFLHTADLHIGKRMNDISLIEDQIFALEGLVHTAKEERVDAVLIAGDIYQTSSPTGEAMEAFDRFVSELSENGIKTIAVSGNHDSPRKVSYMSSLIRASGIYVSEHFDGKVQTVTLSDEYGELDVHLLPFIKPVNVKRCFPEENPVTYQDAVETVIRRSEIDFSRRNVLVAHQYLVGAELSDSEELAVGGLDSIPASVFRGFDYVALGHIHKPQCVGSGCIRYSGSLLQYSFSEANHKKSAVIVDLGEKGSVSVRLVPLRYLHRVREVGGFLGEVTAMPYSEDYVRVTLHDELVPPDARVSVLEVFPNMMKFAVSNSKTEAEEDVGFEKELKGRSVKELFCDFYRLQNNGGEPNAETLKVLDEVLNGLEENSYEAD